MKNFCIKVSFVTEIVPNNGLKQTLMKNVIYISAIVLFFAITIKSKLNFAADEQTFLLIEGTVKQELYNQDKDEHNLHKVVITILDENNKIVEKYHSNVHGKFNAKLKLRRQYQMVLSKNGFVTKKFIVDTSLPKERTSSYVLRFDILLFEIIKGLDITELETIEETIAFNSFMNEFLLNSISYTEMVNTNKKIKKMYAAYYSSTRPDHDLAQLKNDSQKLEKELKEAKRNEQNNKEDHAKKKDGSNYQIQLVEMVKIKIPTAAGVFSKCGTVNETCIDSMYIYTTGDFKDLTSAQNRLSEIINLGFKDAFIFTSNGGKRVAISEAVNKSKK